MPRSTSSSAPIPIPQKDPTKLHKLIATKHQWQAVIERCASHPHEVGGSSSNLRNDKGYTALHMVTAYNHGSHGKELVPVIKAILRAADEIDYAAAYKLGEAPDDEEDVDETKVNTNEITESPINDVVLASQREQLTRGSWRLLLDNNNRAKWAPLQLAKEVEVKAGPINFIVSPNKFHHFFLKSWADKYPSASVWLPPGLKRRKVAEGIRFDQTFGEDEQSEFVNEIDYVIVKGSYVLDEVEFFHKASKTAIINDLIQRHTDNLSGWKGLLMKVDGLAGENGSTPRDWRVTFFPFGKAELVKSRDIIFSWNAEKLIISHGLCAEKDAATVIQKALYWV